MAADRTVALDYLDLDMLVNHYDDVIFEECEEEGHLVQCNRDKECNSCVKCVFKVFD